MRTCFWSALMKVSERLLSCMLMKPHAILLWLPLAAAELSFVARLRLRFFLEGVAREAPSARTCVGSAGCLPFIVVPACLLR